LAFQIVNSCIKNLSLLAKNHLLTKRVANSRGDEAKPRSIAKTTPPDTALRPKSPNARRLKSIDEAYKPSTRTSSAAGIIAACACAALAFLRTHYKVSDGKDSTYQVENGTLAVVGKCIDLELADPALEQLQLLNARLLEHLGSKPGKPQAKRQNVNNFAKLLDFPAETKDSHVLSFAVKVQQHTWQILALQADLVTIEKLAAELTVNADHDAFSLLRHYVRSPEHQVKGTRQLATMSRILLQLSATAGLSADSMLIFRCLAFTLQFEASKLGNGPNEDEAKELSLKLGRCTEAFSRDSKSSNEIRYRRAKSAVVPLLERLQKNFGRTAELLVVCRILGRLAAQAGQVAEAKTWSGASSDKKMSSIDAVRLAAAGISSDEREDLLRQAGAALQEPLPEDRAGSDRLLVQAVALRRAIHKVVSDRSISGDKCFDTAAACLTFLRNYLGYSNGVENYRVPNIDERLRIGRKFAKPFISTVIVCCLHHNDPSLETFCALDSCCDLFLNMVNQDDTFADERLNDQTQPDSSIFVTMSKLCHRIWNQRIATHGSADKTTLAALEMSIKALRPWSTKEKEIGGYIQKMHYLIDALAAQEKWHEAYLAFTQLVQEYEKSNYLEHIVEQAASMSLHRLKDKGSIGGHLFRCLRVFVTILLKSDLGKAEITHSELGLDAKTRGLLLEWQLEQLAQHASQQGPMNKDCTRFARFTFEELLQIYDKKNFPVRRLRVTVMIAQLLTTIPELYGTQQLLSEYLANREIVDFANDSQLKGHYEFLQAILRSLVALRDPHADGTLEALERTMKTWETVCSSISSMDDVHRSINDVDGWCEHLEAAANFYALRRDRRTEARTIELVLHVLMVMPDKLSYRLKMLCQLADARISLGHTGEACRLLELAKSTIETGDFSIACHIRWQLVQAEYLLAISDLDGCRTALEKAGHNALGGSNNSFLQRTFARSSATHNIDEKRLVAKAAYLSGSLELESGRPASAFRLASIAKCMLFKIWSSLEQIMPRERQEATSNSAKTAADPCPSGDEPSAVEGIQPKVMTRSYSHLTSPQLRILVPDLLQVALLEMKIHDFRGAYHEAFAALKHANKISNHVGAGVACLCDTTAADLYLQSLPLNSTSVREDKINEARVRIQMVDEDYLNATKTMDLLAFGNTKAKVMAAEEEPEGQLKQLRDTLEELERIHLSYGTSLQMILTKSNSEAPDQLADQLEAMKLENPRKRAKSTKTKTAASKPAKRAHSVKTTRPNDELQPKKGDADCIPLASLHGSLLREIVVAALGCHAAPDVTALTELMEKASTMVHGIDAVVAQSIASTRLLVHQATEQMTADITFNALHDSIVALPPPRPLENCVARESHASAPAKASRKGKSAKATKTIETSKPAVPSEPPFVSLFENACEMLRQHFSTSLCTSSVARFREQSRLLSSISLTTSTCAARTSLGDIHQLACAYHNDLPGIRTQILNRAVEHPNTDKLSKEDLRLWPSFDGLLPQPKFGTLDQGAFQSDFVDIIPRAWNVVSLSLTDDAAAMKLVRYRQGQLPFVLRVPFAHRESDDPDEGVLDLSLAYERLRSIIKQHEFTPVEAGITHKPEFKRKWWQKKHELDAELRMLLQDVEYQWLTAVKGVFSPQICEPRALANFQTQLQNILMHHCPTKRGRGRGKSALQSLKLEAQVLELFIGLGDPSSEIEVESEDGPVTELLTETIALADGIHDLVRLILENLQFSGESIAIDEIDMDNVSLLPQQTVGSTNSSTRSSLRSSMR
jgi:separase